MVLPIAKDILSPAAASTQKIAFMTLWLGAQPLQTSPALGALRLAGDRA